MKKIIYFIAFLVIAAGIVGAFIIFNNSSEPIPPKDKEKAITKILGRKPNLSDDSTKGNIAYHGKYVSFSYPERAKIYSYIDPNIKKNTSVLETFSFDTAAPRLVFNFSVKENDTSVKSISDIPAVIFRQNKKYGYTESEIEVDGRKGLAFEKNGADSEKSGFIFFNNKLYSISISGSSFKDISLLFNDVINSLDFK